MSKKALKLANRHPMLLALIMATLTLGLLFSGWLTPSHLRAAGATYSNPTPPPNGENTNCDNPTKYLWCAGNAQVVFKDVTISPAAPTNAPYDSIVCVGATVSANLQWFAVPSTYASQTCHTCNGSTPTNYCDPIVYTTGAWPYNIINEWWNDYCWDWPNEIGNSVSFSYTNAMAGCMGFDNISAMMPTNPAGCDVLWYWANNAHSERYYAFVAVDDLSAQYCWPVSDDGINKTYMVCVVPTNAPDTNITVVASPDPGMYDKFLPAGWQMTGGLATTNSDTNDCFISRTKQLVDITKPGTNIVTCVSGCSHKKVTIIAQLVTLGLANTNVMVNNDDDNNDGTNDVDDPISGPGSYVAGESDLIPLTLNVQCIAPTQMVTLSVSMDWWGGGVRVWANSTRGPGEPLLDNSDWSKLSTNWPASQMPATLWVEGVSPSWYLNDVSLSLTTDDGCPAYTNLTVFSAQLGVDMNRDGGISFDSSDATTAANPYCFWLNNNHDGNGSMWNSWLNWLTVQEDLGGSDDLSSTTISCTRDLEDYTRLGINIDGPIQQQLANGDIVVKLESDGPQIRIFPQHSGDGGIDYLKNAGEAQAQITAPYNASLGTVGTVQLPSSFWTNSMTSYLLFDGISGSGKVKVVLYAKDGTKIGQGQPVNLKLQDVKSMYDTWTVSGSAASGGGAYSSTSPELNQYILFVHGWNMTSDEKDQFANTAYKRLWWQNYKGRFGAFDWPTETGFTTFDPSEAAAWTSAQAMAGLLTSLNSQYNNSVYMFAHSLGNVVAGEALKIIGTGNVVNTYVACQAAIAAHAYDPGTGGWTPILPGYNTPDDLANYPPTPGHNYLDIPGISWLTKRRHLAET
jgi:hypothetical protein